MDKIRTVRRSKNQLTYLERRRLARLMWQPKGNKSRTAKEFGVSRSTAYVIRNEFPEFRVEEK